MNCTWVTVESYLCIECIQNSTLLLIGMTIFFRLLGMYLCSHESGIELTMIQTHQKDSWTKNAHLVMIQKTMRAVSRFLGMLTFS